MVANPPGVSKDPQECRASSLRPLLHACVKHGFAWLCSQQDAGRGSHSRSCNPPIPRAQGAELQAPLSRCFYHLPFLFPPALMPRTSTPMPQAPPPFPWPGLSLPQHCPLPLNLLPWSIRFSMAVLRKYWRQQKLCQLAAQF